MSKHSGKKYIWKGTESKRVFPNELQDYLNDGWNLGMVPRSKEKNDSIIAKRNITNLKKYGDKCVLNNDEIKKKLNATCIEKYGANTPLESSIIKEKIKTTNLEKYGVEYQIGSKETQEKIKTTNLEKYGVEYPFQSNEIRNKASQSCFDKYGVYNPFQIEEVIKKCNTEESIKKGFNTKKKNGTCNSSAYEENFYNLLCIKYGNENIIRNYSSDIRYPYHCDFYIKSLDTFIELNLFWTHGPHPFNANSPEDLELLEKWKLKSCTSSFFKSAIDVWTNKDINKLLTARKNNLNYLRYYFDEKRGYKIYDLWD